MIPADEVKAAIRAQHRGGVPMPATVSVPLVALEELLAEHAQLQKKRGARKLIVFAVRRSREHTTMTRIGVALENRDGSCTLQLDALPIGGEIYLREPQGTEVP